MATLAIDGGKPVRTKPWPAMANRFGKEELKQLKETLDQGTLFYMYGAKTKQACAKMAKLSGAKYVVPCSSGSAALHAATKACGVGPGDEVITSPITDAGTVLGIVYEGALPVFADIDPTSYNITAASVAKRITKRTKAVIVVHLAGVPADVKGIIKVCKPKGIKVIEDAAQSWGARIGKKWVGTLGDFGCFSLNDFKHISAGDGGFITTNSKSLYHEAWLSVDKCYDRTGNTVKRQMEFCAPNYRITELQSAVAIAQLGKLKALTNKRNKLGDKLSAGLAKIPGLIPHNVKRGDFATYWFYLMQVDEKVLGTDTATFRAAMNAEGIPGRSGYVEPVHLAYDYLQKEQAFHHSDWPFSLRKGKSPYKPGYCPNAEKVMDLTFNFPLNQGLAASDINDVLKAAKKVAGHYAKR